MYYLSGGNLVKQIPGSHSGKGYFCLALPYQIPFFSRNHLQGWSIVAKVPSVVQILSYAHIPVFLGITTTRGLMGARGDPRCEYVPMHSPVLYYVLAGVGGWLSMSLYSVVPGSRLCRCLWMARGIHLCFKDYLFLGFEWVYVLL